MFLKKAVVDGKAYYAIAESYQGESDHIKTRYIRRLGKLSDLEAARWRLILSAPAHEVPKHFLNLDSIVCYRTWKHGVPALASAIWENFGFSSIVSESLSRISNKGFVARLIGAMVVNRLDDPCSKLKLLDWVDRTSLQFIIDLPPPGMKLHVNHFYRAMDVLWERRDTIERKVYERIVKPRSNCSVIAKDITSTYFEGEKSEIAEYGYSRDHRPDLKQVCWSLIETEEGYPITLEVYAGDTPDKSTVKASIKRLKELFGVERGIFVIDRGMATEDNREVITQAGYNFIEAELLSTNEVRGVVKEALSLGLEEDWTFVVGDYAQQRLGIGEEEGATCNRLKGREIIHGGDRYLVVLNEQKARNELDRLEGRLALGERMISEVEAYARKRPKVGSDAARVIGMVARKLESKKLSPYFLIEGWDGKERRVRYSQKSERVESERRYAGMWVLRTDMMSKSHQEIMKLYKGLWVLEHTFREIKNSLDLRPMWHRKPDRIKAHIWICVMAYLIGRMVEEDLRKNNVLDADSKHYTCTRTFDSFRNVVLNEQGFEDPVSKDAQTQRWWVTTELDRKQLAIINALKVGKDSFALSRGLSY